MKPREAAIILHGRVPVLDVYGSEEYPGVLRMAPRRAEAIKTVGHLHSAQIVIKGVEHYF